MKLLIVLSLLLSSCATSSTVNKCKSVCSARGENYSRVETTLFITTYNYKCICGESKEWI